MQMQSMLFFHFMTTQLVLATGIHTHNVEKIMLTFYMLTHTSCILFHLQSVLLEMLLALLVANSLKNKTMSPYHILAELVAILCSQSKHTVTTL